MKFEKFLWLISFFFQFLNLFSLKINRIKLINCLFVINWYRTLWFINIKTRLSKNHTYSVESFLCTKHRSVSLGDTWQLLGENRRSSRWTSSWQIRVPPTPKARGYESGSVRKILVLMRTSVMILAIKGSVSLKSERRWESGARADWNATYKQVEVVHSGTCWTNIGRLNRPIYDCPGEI